MHRRYLLPLAVAPALLLGTLSGPASAAPTTSLHYVVVGATSKPTTVIGGTPPVFKPSTLTAKRSGTSGTGCTAAKVSFVIANSTAKAQTITSDGKPAAKIPAKTAYGYCEYTKTPLMGTFSLASNKKAKLILKIT